jgi:1-pyrroline-5-carboxylate dehydrogenase
MNNAIYNFPLLSNEPALEYKIDSPERKQLEIELQKQLQNPVEIPLIIGGKEVRTF